MSVTLHMAMSLDGYVAKNNGDLSWMDVTWSPFSKGVEMKSDIIATIDSYIMGSHTYELALKIGWAYGDKRTIVVTSRGDLPKKENVEFYSGDLEALIQSMKTKNVWVVGGPALFKSFFALKLIDKVCLTTLPILLGDGIKLVDGIEQRLKLSEVETFKNGMIDCWYSVE